MKIPFIVATLAAVMLSARAENIAISNPSLETGLSGTNGTVVSGWFSYGGITTSIDVGPGTFWGGGSGMTNADGPNAAYAVAYNANDGGNLYQTVELDAGVTYTLTAAIGMSSSATKSDGKFRIGFYNTGFGGGKQLNGSISTRGGFTDYSVQFTPTTTGNYQIGVRCTGYVPGTGADNNSATIFFDNVRLVVGGTVVYPTSIDVTSDDSVTVQPVNVTIDNGSSGALDITGIQVTGTDSARFTVTTAASPGSPFTIAKGTMSNIQLSFNPGGTGGPVSASLEITSNDPNSPVSIPIGGLIRDPYITTASSVVLPPSSVDAPSNFDVTVQNLGSSDLTLDGAFLSGTDSTYFNVVTNFTNPLVIPGGTSANVTFSFDPGGEIRTFAANLEFDSDDPVEPTRIIPVTAELLPPALSLRLNGNSASTGGGGTGILPIPGAPHPNEIIDNSQVPASSSARNFYYDSDGDLAFTSPGDTSGNTNASLEVDVIVTGTQTLNFYTDVNGDNLVPENFAGNYYRLTGLDITLSDGSKIPLDVTQGTPQTLADPDGGSWSVAFDGVGVLTGSPTDIVGNIDSVPNGTGPDYHFILSFSYTAPGGFSSWAGSFGIPDDETDDSDHDGIPALIEYGLGYNPTVAETLPVLTPVGADFTVTWPKGAQAASDPKISYVVEVSTDLAIWEDPQPADISEDGSGIVLTLQGGQTRKFARFGINRAP